MKHFLKYILLITIGVLLLANLISVTSLFVLRKGSFYKPSFLVNQVKTKTFDYIVLGASTGLTTLNTQIIDSVSGLKGINLAIDDTGISNHYLMLQHFLAEGKKTDYCIIVPTMSGLEDTKEVMGDNDYRFLMYVHRSYVADYYKSLEPKSTFNVLYYSKWMPFLGVSYYNAELFFPSLVGVLKPKKRNRFDAFGNYSYPTSGSPLSTKVKENKRITFSNRYLSKIEALCKNHDIKLLYYFPPNRIETPLLDALDKKVINHSNSLERDLYFYDDIHVNYAGNKAASLLFAEALNKQKDQ